MAERNLTKQQAVAIAHPCAQAEETIHPRFRSVTDWASVILTFNIGEE